MTPSDRRTAIGQIRRLAVECGEPNWDGSQALAVDDDALTQAERFLRALPHDVAAPSAAPEPDGCVSLDWMPSRHRVFSVSISRGDRVAFAWLDGDDSGHGVERFEGASIPLRLIEGIRSVMRADAHDA
jgi:hypothetical protein